MICPDLVGISIARQCELLGISRAGYYYQPVPVGADDLELMRLIDIQFTATPFYGTRRMTEFLRKYHNKEVERKRIRRLMRLMGLETIYPKPNLSKPAPENRVYPYLLRGVTAQRSNHIWSTDITYIPMQRGFLYLVAILDWYSRCVLSWELSNTLEASFCVEALRRALERFGAPEIFNSDQGAQFTSNQFTGVLAEREIKISMDGRGRALDNIFIERLWRSVKYEEVYIRDYQTGQDAYTGLDRYFTFYNERRPHQALDYATPREVYSQNRPCGNSG
jgi:putative transposase